MLAKRLIPCLDVDRGRVVKGVRFVSLRDAGDPVECAARYDAEGADELVFLDITASSDARPIVLDMVRRVADTVFLPFTVGGGVRSVEDADELLRAGADKVAVNTAAVADPELLDRLAARFGRQCIVLSIDARRGAVGYDVVTHSGKAESGLQAAAWAADAVARGAGEILLTSHDRDGTRAGYDLELIRAVRPVVDVPIIASGGANHAEHLRDALAAGADAVLAASIFHDGDASVMQVKAQLAALGVAVRR
jgi:cyclase